MDWWLLFAVFLYFACAMLLVAEVFIPSGGLIGILALICLIGGVAIFFNHSILAGWIGIATAIVMIPATVVFAYRIFPKTRFGKAVLLTPPHDLRGSGIPDTDQLKSLIGRTGVVHGPLRPVGICDFSGQRVECTAEGGYVDKGKQVKVINVESTRVVVRAIDVN